MEFRVDKLWICYSALSNCRPANYVEWHNWLKHGQWTKFNKILPVLNEVFHWETRYACLTMWSCSLKFLLSEFRVFTTYQRFNLQKHFLVEIARITDVILKFCSWRSSRSGEVDFIVVCLDQNDVDQVTWCKHKKMTNVDIGCWKPQSHAVCAER